MEPIYSYRRPLKRTLISPGVVGSVGDVLGSVRLKQSTPSLPMRFEPNYEPSRGSNVQDGYSYSFTSGGGPAHTVEEIRHYHPADKTVSGFRYQDLRAPDKSLGPILGSTGRYDWYNRVANIYQAKITGDMFLPLPGPFQPTSVTRGSQMPRVIATDTPGVIDLTGNTANVKKTNKAPAVVCTKADGTQTFRRT